MKPIVIGAIISGSAALSALAWAGYKGDTVTWVTNYSDGTGSAAGNLGYARNSPNMTENIGCNVDAWTSGTTVRWYMSCAATDARGNSGYCYSYDDKMVQLASSLGTDGFVQFNWNA